ncbi:MAG: aldehyde ferredoxin oxidoreductase family protein [Candidatus Ranarchaeia archaeon]
MVWSYNGKILSIDLSSQKVSEIPLKKELVRRFIGGMGIGTKLIFDKMPVGVDPLSPQNIVFIGTGPVNGTGAQMFAQTCLVTKSPLSGTILNSYTGGHLSPQIKKAGVDGILLSNSSEKPVYLHIKNGQAYFHSAKQLWGLDTFETQKRLSKLIGEKCQTLAIGPAGERMVRFATVQNARRSFGRGGPGAVLGAKNVKGIVFSGDTPIHAAHPEEYREALKELKEAIQKGLKGHTYISSITDNGTSTGNDIFNPVGHLATRNHQTGVFPPRTGDENWYGPTFLREYHVKHYACYMCPVHCGKYNQVREGEFKGLITEGPEYETCYAFGNECGNENLPAIIKADILCDSYGMDTISCGVTIAWAMEAFEKNVISKEDTDGIDLRFGNYHAMLETVEKIANREGIGDLLAEGSKRAAEKIGHDSISYAMQVKGLEFPGWMPRVMKGAGLGFATSPRGACHKRALLPEEYGGGDIEQREEKVIKHQDEVNARFTLVACGFLGDNCPESLYAKLITHSTGIEFDAEEFLKTGARIWHLERTYNVLEGYTRDADVLPDRCFEPIQTGPAKGRKFKRAEFDKMLDRYYELRGWSSEGIPSAKILKEFGLPEAEQRLRKAGLL